MVGKELPSSGEPRTTLNSLRQEQRGNQPLPNVWFVLERKVLLHAPQAIGIVRESPRWWKMVSDVGEQQEQLWEKGSDYDRAVLDLYTAVTAPSPATERPLTLKQFKQLRSDFEELSAEEIVQEKRQLLQDMQELRQDAYEIRFQPES